MRETKFRGLNRNSNKWHYGSLLVTRQLGIHHAQIWLLDEDYPVPVDIETTGEWIGLTDKHGKEIYEGDIVATGIGPDYTKSIVRIGEAKTEGSEFCSSESYYGVYLEGSVGLMDYLLQGEMHIVGNIYEKNE